MLTTVQYSCMWYYSFINEIGSIQFKAESVKIITGDRQWRDQQDY